MFSITSSLIYRSEIELFNKKVRFGVVDAVFHDVDGFISTLC